MQRRALLHTWYCFEDLGFSLGLRVCASLRGSFDCVSKLSCITLGLEQIAKLQLK